MNYICWNIIYSNIVFSKWYYQYFLIVVFFDSSNFILNIIDWENNNVMWTNTEKLKKTHIYNYYIIY